MIRLPILLQIKGCFLHFSPGFLTFHKSACGKSTEKNCLQHFLLIPSSPHSHLQIFFRVAPYLLPQGWQALPSKIATGYSR